MMRNMHYSSNEIDAFGLERQLTQFELSGFSLNYVKPIPLRKVGTAIIGLNYPSVWIIQGLIMQVPLYNNWLISFWSA